jgi:hypothetical protein
MGSAFGPVGFLLFRAALYQNQDLFQFLNSPIRAIVIARDSNS